MTDTPTEPTAPAPAPEAAPKAPAPQRPGKAQALAVLERLFQLYPAMFGARFHPLKLGVYQELVERHPTEFAKEDLKAALGLHARSTRYLESVAAGDKRHDLEGNPLEDVAPEHVHHAIMEVSRRRQGRGKDPKAWLQQRLLAAIEASGLSREDYTARVNAQGEALAALDEAFAELSARAAKNEALRRAFEASGKSVAEFADMYGMKPADVARAVRQPGG